MKTERVAVLAGPNGPVVCWRGTTERLQAEATPAVDADGRVHFEAIRVWRDDGGPFVGSDELRAVPVTAMLSAANRSRRMVLMELAELGDPTATKAFEELPLEPEVEVVPAPKTRPAMRLRVPSGRKPNAFYAQIASAYAWLIEEAGSRRPAVDIAEANAVPVSTAHRWIREARRRGILGPGVRGRVGL